MIIELEVKELEKTVQIGPKCTTKQRESEQKKRERWFEVERSALISSHVSAIQTSNNLFAQSISLKSATDTPHK
jgi:hypothetical protein